VKALIRAVHAFSGFGGWLAVIMICLALGLALAEILARSLLNRTLYITEEYSGYLMCTLTFSSLAYTLRERGHIRMVFVLRALSDQGRHFLNLACHTVGLLFGLGFTYFCSLFFWDSVVSGSQSMQVSETYLAIPQVFMPLGALMLTLQFLGEVMKDILLIRGDTAGLTLAQEADDLGR
ncbi:MAG: TRAP transporter small permease, partial [Desulfobacterales bacterium]|jgi:TRAP-type C4-dicarboxylate transport system permease small subunit|nr:TRAP transporter small permease [Desulfobacterales bacterium]